MEAPNATKVPCQGVLTTSPLRARVIWQAGTGEKSVSFQLGKFLVIAGVVLVAVGLLLMAAPRISFLGLGRLPGDITYKGRNTTFYFPIVSCLVLSVILTLILWVISFLTKR